MLLNNCHIFLFTKKMSTILNNEQILAKNYCLETINNLLKKSDHMVLNLSEIKNLIFERSIGLSGDPGTGKSTVVFTICKELHCQNLNFSIITPSASSFDSFSNYFNQNLKKLSDILRRVDNADGQKIKLLPEEFYKSSVCNDEKSILQHHVIIFEDASLYTSTDIDDLASRMKIDFVHKYFRENKIGISLPVFLFCGDAKQLIPPQNKLFPDFNSIGYISEKILSNDEKCFTLRNIHRQPILIALAKTIKTLLSQNLETNLKSLFEDYLPENFKINFECAKKLYVNLIDINNNTIWIRNFCCKNTEKDLRNEYSNLMKGFFLLKNSNNNNIDCEFYFVGEYVKLISNFYLTTGYSALEDFTATLPTTLVESTYLIKSGQRFKIINIFETKLMFNDLFKNLFIIQNQYETIEIFETINPVNVVIFSLCYLNQHKHLNFIHVPQLQIKPGVYDNKNNTLSNIEILLNKETIFKIKNIKYSNYLKIKEMLYSYDIDHCINRSYVCTPYDYVGKSIDFLFFDVRNFKEQNYFNLSSLNMLLSRVTKRVYFVTDDKLY